MFERRIEETIAFLTRETIAGQDRISSRQLAASSIPKSLKMFFDRDIGAWVEEEKQRLLASTHFLYSDEAILGKFDSITDILPDYALFTNSEYEQSLERNVKLLFNYVCRPQWSLVRFFFSDREHVPTNEIVRDLKYFWHYEYYRLILTEYFSKKAVEVIEARKFENLIENIDQEITRNFDSKKLASLTEPIFELFNLASDAETPVVPIEALSIYFDDKSLTSIVDRLDREKTLHEYISMHDLVILIGDVDYTMSLDISSIVNQHARSLGVMPPERLSHAGTDFEVPNISAMEQEPVDIADHGKHLDFVISEEEQGVIERDFDSVPELHQIVEDASDDEEELMVLPVSEDGETDFREDDVISVIEPEDVDDEDEDASSGYNFTEAGILQLEDELNLDEDLQEDEDAALTTANELKDFEEFDVEESLLTAENELDEYEDDIPEASADDRFDIADLGMIDDEQISHSTSILANDDIEMNILLAEEEESPSVDAVNESTELEIDWEKEASNIPDLNIEEETTSRIVEGLPSEVLPSEQSGLKPADELLSQLNLDDFDDPESASPSSHHSTDIPLFHDENYPKKPVSAIEREEEEEPPVPAEDVIRQFGDLQQQISSSEQKKYAKKLFKKNEDTVRHALIVLNGKSTWREASEYIDELFIKYDVDMYSRIAVQFTDEIYKRYLPRK